MKVCLINLPLLGLKNDLYGNIPSLPVGLCYLAAHTRQKGHDVMLIDMYGLAPAKRTVYMDRFDVWGITQEEAVGLIPKNTDLVGISVHSVAGYSLAIGLIEEIKRACNKPVVLGGGCTTVLAEDFIRAGADYVILSEGEYSFNDLLDSIAGKNQLRNIDGIVFGSARQEKTKFIENLDLLPFPAFDLLPLENYWRLGYAHGPVSGKYLTLVSSRGCPFKCAFCASPLIWQRRWRSRSAENVVSEIEFFMNKLKVFDFHFQDDAFSIDRKRVVEIAQLLCQKNLNIKWSLPAGVKVETLDEEMLRLMKKSGFTYISVSPESGSKKVLDLMKKPFDYEHMLNITVAANKLGIFTQACFVLGFPQEKWADITKTAIYIIKLAIRGIDEIACYIMTPLPGAEIFSKDLKFGEYEDLNFSPKWRKDFNKLNTIRLFLYFLFFFN